MATIADRTTAPTRTALATRLGITRTALDALLDPDTCRARQAVNGDIGPCDPGARIVLAAWPRGTRDGGRPGMAADVTAGCARHIAVHAAARVGADVELTSLSL